jgi:hypothetical protein
MEVIADNIAQNNVVRIVHLLEVETACATAGYIDLDRSTVLFDVPLILFTVCPIPGS